MNRLTSSIDFDAPAAVAVALPAAARAETGRASAYLELTKPRLNSLVVITAMVGFYMAGGSALELGQWVLLLNLLVGTALTAGGASALNQLWERDLDARMPRTQDRPLPAGRVTPLQALGFALILSVAGVGYLALTVNGLTAAIGAVTLLSYVLVYTPMKRRSTLNTVVGAIPGALPPVMGMTAFDNALSPEALALFTIMFIWQTPHFLAIAVLYRRDYAAAGFRMLPVVDPGLHMTSRQILMYCLALVPVSLVPAMLGMAGALYVAAALVLGLGFVWYGLRLARTKQRPEARRLFLASVIYLPLLFGAMMISRL